MKPTFHEIRKTYVNARTETIPTHVLTKTGMNYRKAAKNIAHQEFNEFIQEIREQAVNDYLAAQAEAMGYRLWEQGFSAGMKQWQKQREDPTHPITRNNPYIQGR